MDTSPKILSLMEEHMGHGTYGNLLREGFAELNSTTVDFYWYPEERKFDTKFLRWLLSLSFPNSWIQKQNLDFRRLRAQLSYAYMARKLAIKKLKQYPYSALHFHTYILAFLSLDLMAKLPTVVSLDMTTYQAAFEQTEPNFMWTYAPNILLGKKVFQAAKGIVTRSEWGRQSVIRDYKIEPEKVKVIYPGVDITKLTPTEKSEEEQKPFNMLFIGTDFKRKGGDDVVAVFLDRFSDRAELNLVTNAPITYRHSRIHIHRNVKAYSSEWLKLYHQADVFIMPTYFEGFGWVFLEAMAAGLPVIATDINAIPEMVTHGETGFLIQPGDRSNLATHLQYLIDNPSLAREMGAKGRKKVEKYFNARLHCQTLANMFDKIIAHENSTDRPLPI
ncbi:MAG: glycosyltransferase family 4 protein [Xenococcaceae cyanobacterium MO_188.B32]|nr:glycosyltransferase family 4 protein [Xenococcaceae cyanobacterium MO_188.B32]